MPHYTGNFRTSGRNYRFNKPDVGIKLQAGHIGQVPLEVKAAEGTQTGNLIEVRLADVGESLRFVVNESGQVEGGARFTVSRQLLAADVDQAMFICPVGRTCRVLSISEIHSVVGGASAAVQPRRGRATETPAAGDLLTTATIDLTATVNTIITPTLTATDADRVLAAGDRITLDFAGTLTGLVGAITIDLVYES